MKTSQDFCLISTQINGKCKVEEEYNRFGRLYALEISLWMTKVFLSIASSSFIIFIDNWNSEIKKEGINIKKNSSSEVNTECITLFLEFAQYDISLPQSTY